MTNSADFIEREILDLDSTFPEPVEAQVKSGFWVADMPPELEEAGLRLRQVEYRYPQFWRALIILFMSLLLWAAIVGVILAVT